MKTKKSLLAKIILVVITVVLLVFAGIWAYDLSRPSAPKGPTPEQKQLQKTTETEQKKTYVETDDTTQPVDPQPAPIPSDTSSINITATQEGGNVIVQSRLNGPGYSSGTCVLDISNGQRTFSSSANILYQSDYSTCAGFSVATSSLGTGTWAISLRVTPLNGSSLTKSVTFEVK